jgi:hypothetical protein
VESGRDLADDQGFFTVYRNLFALLASDEALHTDHPLEYPTFGDSATPYAPPKDASRAEKDAGRWTRDFYVVWAEFTSEKKFEWVAKWDVERGSDRQMRRLMERDNKKIRDDYKREYSEAVRVSSASSRGDAGTNRLATGPISPTPRPTVQASSGTSPGYPPRGEEG